MEITAKVKDPKKKRKEELSMSIKLGEQAIRHYTRKVEEAKKELKRLEDGEN